MPNTLERTCDKRPNASELLRELSELGDRYGVQNLVKVPHPMFDDVVETIVALTAEVDQLKAIVSQGVETVAGLASSLATAIAAKEAAALRQLQQSDLIECYTQEGIRQRKEISALQERNRKLDNAKN